MKSYVAGFIDFLEGNSGVTPIFVYVSKIFHRSQRSRRLFPRTGRQARRQAGRKASPLGSLSDKLCFL